MSKASNYYYEQLNKEQQKAYYAMKEGLLNQQDSLQCQCLIKRNYLIFILWCVWTARKFFIPCVFRTGIIRILRQLNLSRSIYFKKTKSGNTVRQCRRVSKSLQDRRRDWMKREKSCLSMILSYKMCGMTN